jgi:hypothetical protein
MDLKELQIAARDGSVARHPWELARLNILQSWLERFAPRPGAILDVGCGDGFLLSSISDRVGGPCIGVDSALELELLATLPGIELFRSLDEIAGLQSVSAIFLMDVLEHIAQPQELLFDLKARGLLAEGTVVMITVPACQGIYSEHDRFLGHYRRYSLAELRRLLSEAGLVPLEDGYMFASLLFIRWLESLYEKAGRRGSSPTGVAKWEGPPWLTKALTRLLLWDAAVGRALQSLLRLKLPGLSCYSVCQLAR